MTFTNFVFFFTIFFYLRHLKFLIFNLYIFLLKKFNIIKYTVNVNL